MPLEMTEKRKIIFAIHLQVNTKYKTIMKYKVLLMAGLKVKTEKIVYKFNSSSKENKQRAKKL